MEGTIKGITRRYLPWYYLNKVGPAVSSENAFTTPFATVLVRVPPENPFETPFPILVPSTDSFAI